MPKFKTKTCPNCLAAITECEVYHNGYQGQDYTRVEFPQHELEDCIKHLRSLIDDTGSRRIV